MCPSIEMISSLRTIKEFATDDKEETDESKGFDWDDEDMEKRRLHERIVLESRIDVGPEKTAT